MPLPRHVLVVDDDDGITQLLCDYLAGFGFVAHAAHDGASMRAMLAAWPIALVVLDLQLPGEDGLALAQALRAPGPQAPCAGRTPIIMLSARAQPIDRVIGLEMGADDYMAKPFEPRELVARIHTVLRRAAALPPAAAAAAAAPPGMPAAADLVRFDGWSLEHRERRLTSPRGERVALSDAEFRLLAIFLKSPRRVCSRNQLVALARGRTLGSVERSIDLLVSRLRQKLADDPREPRLIKTVRGAGYLFDAVPVTAPGAARH
jgi:two-component system OmpR family response regulator